MKPIRSLLFLFLIICFACNNVPKEIISTPLYENVINHYERIEENEDKKNAALFLFENMRDKYSIFDSKTDSILTFISDSIKQVTGIPENMKIVKTLIQKSPNKTNPEIVLDYEIINSNDLISHIDITYESWKRLSRNSGATFHDFCQYILPYRIKNEPILELSTKMFRGELNSLVDTLMATDSVVHSISNFINSFECRLNLKLSDYYQYTFSPQHLLSLRTAPRCDDFVILLALSLRSIGVPATYDYLPQWGNHHFYGHSWLAIKWQKQWYAFDAVDGKFLNDMYHDESIPKAFRQLYSNSKLENKIDVTNEYRQVTDLCIDAKGILKSVNVNPAIAVFNKFKGFKVVDFGRKTRTNLVFEDLGRKVIYFVGKVENERFQPLMNPIFIDSLGGINHLNPNWEALNGYVLERKYPLTSGNRDRRKGFWAKSISGSWIEASNNNFSDVDTLLVFKNYNSFKEERFQIETDKAYKAVRFRCGEKNQVATLKFFDRKHNLLVGEIVHDLWKGFKPEKIFDNNMLTWSRMGNPKRYVSVGYKFETPQYISSVSVQTRNDGNHIVPGDNYELLVYDNGWKSLDEKTAEKQELYFTDVPSGGLYWLKNLSQGTEELPFMFDSNKNQTWAGQ